MRDPSKEATLTAAFIGHKISPFVNVKSKLVAGCELCGKTVTVTGKSFSGDAVTTKCSGAK